MGDTLLADPRDELLHAPRGDASMPWKDTWYFSLLDPVCGVHLAMHMTVTAGRAEGTRVAVGLRDGGRESVATSTAKGTASESLIGSALGWVEMVRLSWGPDHQVRWRADAPEFELDVLVQGVHVGPFFDALFPGVNPTGRCGHSYSHVEQVIRGEGTVRWRDGRRRAVSAFGWRDRGWGRRTNELSFGTGYDLVSGILPDGAAFALSAMRNVEHGADARLPVYGFLTDGASTVPAVAGTYQKDSMCFPSRLGLEFADGRRVDGEQVGHLSTLSVPFHDAAPAVFGIAVSARDHYATLADPTGERFPVFSNEGHALRCDVTSGGRFFHSGQGGQR